MFDLIQKKHELDEQGYTVLPHWASRTLISDLRSTVERLYQTEGNQAGYEFRQEPGCLRLANLVDKDEVFLRVIVEPVMLILVEHVLGTAYKLSSLNARTALPGCEAQPLHADMGGVPDEHGSWVCNIIWMLDAYTETNGAIRLVPGSHRWRKLPQEEMTDLRAKHPAEIMLTAAAGSVVVMNAHTWHGGLANTGSERRTSLHAFYCRRDKPQQQYQKRMLRPDVQLRLSKELRHLLALDDPQNDVLSSGDVVRSGFLK